MSSDSTKQWMKLDNAAKIYPAVKSRTWTALFRLSAELTDPIDPQLLCRALSSTLKRFPSFSVRLRHGFFWYYFEQIDGAPQIQHDVANPCARMDLRENNGFMFRVRYHANRIAIEIFHALTDGAGGLCFLKTLVAEYLTLKYKINIPRSNQILDCSEQPKPDELEDSFLKFARQVGRSRSESSAYHITGTSGEPHYLNIITGKIPAHTLIAYAKEHDVTVTEFLAALLIQSIYRLQSKEHSRVKRYKPVKICIPINLRKFYPTNTMRNFSSYINPGIEPKYGNYTFEEILKNVHYYMGLELTEKLLNAKMSTNVITERNMLLRATPLFIKNPTMKFVFRMKGDRQSSSTISNLGVISLPEEMSRYVTRMDFMLGPLSHNCITCGVLTYCDSLIITFTRSIKETDVERNFFRALIKMGIPVKIESNQR